MHLITTLSQDELAVSALMGKLVGVIIILIIVLAIWKVVRGKKK